MNIADKIIINVAKGKMQVNLKLEIRFKFYLLSAGHSTLNLRVKSTMLLITLLQFLIIQIHPIIHYTVADM